MFCRLCDRTIIRISPDVPKYIDTLTRLVVSSSALYSTSFVWHAAAKSPQSKRSDAKPSNPVEEVKLARAKAPEFLNLPSTTVGEKVKQAGKDVFYTGIVIFGIGVTGVMGYAIFRELMSSKSPSGVYADAFKLCKKDVRVKSILGEPVKAYGDLSGLRGRRRHVQSAEFLDGDAHILQLKFYLSGPYNSATVYVEKDVSTSTYRTLTFETDDHRERFSLLSPPSMVPSLFT